MSGKLTEHEKTKGVWFTSVSHEEESRELLKKNCEEFPFWAWIDHAPDKETDEEDKHFHTHVIISTRGSRSIKQVANSLGIPSNYVQVVRQKRSLMRYLRHLDNPEKIQYGEDDVHTNKKATLQIAWTDNQDSDVRRLFSDLDKLKRSQITASQFVELHYLEFQKMPFYQKIKTYELIDKLEWCAKTT